MPDCTVNCFASWVIALTLLSHCARLFCDYVRRARLRTRMRTRDHTFQEALRIKLMLDVYTGMRYASSR